MAHQSNISGYIMLRDHEDLGTAEQDIASFPFDGVYPFSNIFWTKSPSQYSWPVIGLAGSFKQVEDDWGEWLWKFSLLLSRLEALKARVYLNSLMGDHFWELEPACIHNHDSMPASLLGQKWGITRAPLEDFSIETWDMPVERWS